jgi:hypothetical protein
VEIGVRAPDRRVIKWQLSEIAYAPKGRCNLLSVGMLVEKADIRGYFDKKSMIFSTKDGRNVGHATLSNGLYHLEVEEPMGAKQVDDPFKTREVVVAVVDFDDPVWKMHRRLGYLSMQNMLNLQKFSDGMGLTEKQSKAKFKAICPVCATTRALIRIPRDPAKRHATESG